MATTACAVVAMVQQMQTTVALAKGTALPVARGVRRLPGVRAPRSKRELPVVDREPCPAGLLGAHDLQPVAGPLGLRSRVALLGGSYGSLGWVAACARWADRPMGCAGQDGLPSRVSL